MGVTFGGGPFTGRVPGQGETDITQMGVGQRFYVPDTSAKLRLKDYLEADKLLDVEEHLALFKASQGGEPPDPSADKFWIPLDFPGMLTRLMRHYTVGRDFRVSAKLRGELPSGAAVSGLLTSGQDVVDRIVEHNGLAQLLRKVTEALPAKGDAVLRIDVEQAEDDNDQDVSQARVRFVKPEHYFPTLDMLDGTRTSAVTLAWVFPAPEVSGQQRVDREMVVLREVHVPGQVEYKLNKWDGDKLGDELSVQSMFPDLEDFETGIDEIPVVHLGYQVRAGEHFGRSELLRVQRIILALENRLSQEDEVLEKHARPKLIVGPGILDDEGRANLKDFDVIEVSPDVFEKAVKPEYLTWDMQTAGITHEIEKLEEYLFMTTETSPASFGLERDGSQVESARALRFKAHRTVNKVHDLRDELDGDIRALFRIAQKYELAERRRLSQEGYRRVNVQVDYGDPILEDTEAEVQQFVQERSAGLVSRRRAVRDLHELTNAETEAEVRDILQDQVDDAAAATASFQGLTAGGGEAAPPAGTAGPTGEVPPAEETEEEV